MTAPLLLSAAEMRRVDDFAAKGGVAGAQLMERAGEGVARMALKDGGPRRVAVLCGPGNNGGDGFVAARRLKDAGWAVRVGLLGEKSALKGDAALMAGLYDGPLEPLASTVLDGAELIVDAVFGIGLARPIEGAARAAIEAANAHPAPVFAVDIPTGVHADTGQELGVAVRAARTATFAAKKPGHVLFPGRAFCGEVEVVDIGIPDSAIAAVNPLTYENHPALWAASFRRPDSATHKYSRGHAAVISGGRLKTGAARLAARAALRAGAGLVTMFAPPDAADEIAAHLTATMLREAGDARAIAEILADRRFTAALIGPGAGVGAPTREKTLAVLKSGAAAVLDADALTSFEGAPDTLFGALRSGDVLTPHTGEFSRLFKEVDLGSLGKLEGARAASRRAKAVVVLKGADTVIAAPDGRAAVNVNAPPDLATAGSGDVLGGIVLGELAQGVPAFEAAAIAVWLHGACGQVAGPGLIAEDLPEALPRVLTTLLAPASARPKA